MAGLIDSPTLEATALVLLRGEAFDGPVATIEGSTYEDVPSPHWMVDATPS